MAWDGCRAEPAGCDVEGFIAEFSTPDSVAAQIWRNSNTKMVEAQQHSIDLDKIERFVASIDVDGDDAVTEVCVRDAAVGVAADRSVVDDAIGLFRYEWLWSRIDNKWTIVGGSAYQITETGSAICDAYFQ